MQHHRQSRLNDFRQFQLSDPRRLDLMVKRFSVPFQPRGASLSMIRKKIEMQKYCDNDIRKRTISMETVQSDRKQDISESGSENQPKALFKLMPQCRQVLPKLIIKKNTLRINQ